MAEVLKGVNCRNCGAPLSLEAGEVIITCDYCGSDFNQASDKAFVLEHSIIPNKYDGDGVRGLVKGWMRGGSKPRSLAGSARIRSVELSYLPFFVIEVDVTTEYKGGMERMGGWTPREGELRKEYHWKVLGRRGSKFPTREYAIPMSAKVGFDLSRVPKGSNIINSELDEDEAVKLAKQNLGEHHEYLLSQEVDSLDRTRHSFKVDEVEFIHAPVWYVRYEFKGKTYEVLVDGASGDVIRGEVPPPDTSVKGFFATMRSALFGD